MTSYPEDVSLHTDRLFFELTQRDGPAAEAGGGLVDRVAWLTLAEAAELSLTPFTAEVLGLPVTPLPPAAHRSRDHRFRRSTPTAGCASGRTGWSPTLLGGSC